VDAQTHSRASAYSGRQADASVQTNSSEHFVPKRATRGKRAEQSRAQKSRAEAAALGSLATDQSVAAHGRRPMRIMVADRANANTSSAVL
jgi:hypothetical protein